MAYRALGCWQLGCACQQTGVELLRDRPLAGTLAQLLELLGVLGRQLGCGALLLRASAGGTVRQLMQELLVSGAQLVARLGGNWAATIGLLSNS